MAKVPSPYTMTPVPDNRHVVTSRPYAGGEPGAGPLACHDGPMHRHVEHNADGGKVSKVMDEFRAGDLHSGSKDGPVVTSRDQAIAIGLSEQRKHGD